MDIEQLSKSQIVLLTLLVSFVTSIATGIVTVSLMDQAPPAVAQTVNRVIERTIETVAATSTPHSQAAASVVTQEKTVVVNESDLMAQAVVKISPSIVRLYTSDAQNPIFLGLGLVLDDQGYIFTDSSALGDNADATLVMPDGTRERAFVTKRDKDTGFAYLQATSTTETTQIPTWKPIAIATNRPVLGEAVIALSGKTVSRISPGVITSIEPASSEGVVLVDTNIPASDIMSGSVIVNTDGSVVGVSTGTARASSTSGFISTSILVAPPSAKSSQ